MMFCCAIAALCACNKDNSTEPNHEQGANPVDQLRAFRKQMEQVRTNPEAKSDETLSVSEALWDVENYFNLTYSDMENYYSQVNDHEFTVTLPVDDQDQILVYDAVALYDEVVNQARSAMQSDELENKAFVSLTLKEVSHEGRGVAVTFTGKVGNRCNHNYQPIENHINGPFGEDDDWMYASPLGKCDDPDIPSGADEQLQERLYAELIEPFVRTESDCRNIYTDRRQFVFDGRNYPGIYYNEDTGNLCIDHYSMNARYHAEKNVISRTIPDQYYLTGYSPISIAIFGILTDDWGAVTHRNEVEYGIRSRVSIEEFGTIENLIP